MSRKLVKHLLETNFMSIGDKVKHLRKPYNVNQKSNGINRKKYSTS